ncbi:Serine/threonine exchanger SteT [Stieleria maiorica]|uniref:Serine/threonine exchanger SteT n=1 Tax=Stieleria maiorica TaxID=2795974 RepID=A0A5B9MI36_9BACT|nr:amino acid permease [Stieleria maiorica]QEG00972.1 Serine/threonine exchanger SteT [Stieleria maiorica]
MNAPSAAAVVAASMIGAGVYTTSGFTLGDLGQPHLVIAAWVIGGVIAICGALCYGALAQQFTESGGEYLFLARAIHPAAGMMAGWVSLLAGFTGAMAFAATTFESYVRGAGMELFDGWPDRSIAIGLVVLAAVVHSLGLKRGTRIQNGVVLAKLVLIGLFLLIAFGTVSTWQGTMPELAHSPSESAITAADATDAAAPPAENGWAFALVFANALTWISLSYSGFNAAVYLTDEIEQPTRNVPRAMLWGTVGVAGLYVLLNIVFVYAPPASEVAGRPDVATSAADAVGRQIQARGSDWGMLVGPLVRVAILAGLGTSVLALMQTGPRVYQKMAADRLLPRLLAGRTDEGQLAGGLHQSLPTIWIQAILAVVVIGISTLREQLDYLGFTLSICAALCGSLVFLFRNHAVNPVRVRGYPLVPAIYVLGTLGIAALTAIRVPLQAAVGLGTLGIGIAAYLGSRFVWGSRAFGDR